MQCEACVDRTIKIWFVDAYDSMSLVTNMRSVYGLCVLFTLYICRTECSTVIPAASRSSNSESESGRPRRSPQELYVVDSQCTVNETRGAVSWSWGDFNADGISDVVVVRSDGIRGAAVFVIFGTLGRPVGTSRSPLVDVNALEGGDGYRVYLEPPDSWDQFVNESSVSSGDVNGDGIGDVVAGFPNPFPHGAGGVVAVLYGRKQTRQASTRYEMSSIPEDSGFVVRHNSSTKFGICVAASGDINADGIQDILISSREELSPGYTVYGSTRRFSALISLSNPKELASYGDSIVFQTEADQFGNQRKNTVHILHDINGDAADDILVVTQTLRKGSEGYIFYGLRNVAAREGSLTRTLFSQWNVRITALGPASDETADSVVVVSQAGDWNEDGIHDFFIGAHTGPKHIVFRKKSRLAELINPKLNNSDGISVDSSSTSNVPLRVYHTELEQGIDLDGDRQKDKIMPFQNRGQYLLRISYSQSRSDAVDGLSTISPSPTCSKRSKTSKARTSTPRHKPSGTRGPGNSDDTGLGSAAIAGISTGAILGAVGIGTALYYGLRRRQRKLQHEQTQTLLQKSRKTRASGKTQEKRSRMQKR
eukprot:gb/GECG01013354.1/.p1 GENE.gb/GECG01013354.1/~~gb/GECG01013354.1/.p1  ORF type:complete len:594 (+),score=55.08 gb/GECG01013354.1/:1-1782(+)